jgi:hypothetical protein
MWLQTTWLTNGQHYVQGGNGRDVFWLFVDERTRTKSNLKTFPGVVCKGPYPLQCTTIFCTLPWLAYCSGAFFQGQEGGLTKGMPAPWRVALVDPLAHIYQTRYTILPGSPGLPQEVTFQPDPAQMAALKSGDLPLLAIIDGSARDSAVVQVASYYAMIGEPEAVYRVTRTTNYAGRVLPLQFSFDRFAFRRSTNGVMKRIPFGSTRGQVDTIATISALDPLPRSPDDLGISVGDYRFFNRTSFVPFISYVATNSSWITNEADPYLRHIYDLTAARSLRHHLRQKYSSWSLCVLFLLGLSGPMLLKRVRHGVLGYLKAVLRGR